MSLADLEVASYILKRGPHNDILIEMRHGYDEDHNIIDRWAITDGHGILDKDGDWVVEPSPSSRDEEYYRKARFATAEEAYEFWKQQEAKQ